jgi:hypothetical protein
MIASVKSPKPIESRAAAINNRVTGLLNCDKKRMTDDDFDRVLKLLSPYCLSLAPAAAPDRPFSVDDSNCKTSSFLRLQKFSTGGFSIVQANYFVGCQLTAFVWHSVEAATIPDNASLIIPFLTGSRFGFFSCFRIKNGRYGVSPGNFFACFARPNFHILSQENNPPFFRSLVPSPILYPL